MEKSSGYWQASSVPASFHRAGHAKHQRRKANHSLSQLQTLWAIITVLARYAHCCSSGMSVTRVTKCFMIEFKTCSMRWNPYLAVVGAKSLWLAKSLALRENLLLLSCWTETVLKQFLLTYCHTQRSMHGSFHIKEALPFSRWKLTQRPTMVSIQRIGVCDMFSLQWDS